MTTPCYVSIDGDYFNFDDRVISRSLMLLTEYLDWLQSTGVPVCVVTNHHQMLQDVAMSKARTLYNYDEHSDLTEIGESYLNCATWTGYVPWRAGGRYVWVHPVNSAYGDCNGLSLPIFAKRGIARRNVSDWGKLHHLFLPPNQGLEFLRRQDVVGAGIALSPTYTDFAVERHLRVECKRRGWQIKRGLRDENGQGRMVRPVMSKRYLAKESRRLKALLAVQEEESHD